MNRMTIAAGLAACLTLPAVAEAQEQRGVPEGPPPGRYR